MDFVISDTHFGHRNIISHCNRPFKDVKEMDDHMVSEWNKVVKPQDTVYHLGDVAWTLGSYLDMLDRVNGRIILIHGNHDKRWISKNGMRFSGRATLEFSRDVLMYKANKKKVWMSHYCHMVWPDQHRGSYHLFGHSHNTLQYTPRMSMDVSVDNIGFAPVLIEQILERIDARSHIH